MTKSSTSLFIKVRCLKSSPILAYASAPRIICFACMFNTYRCSNFDSSYIFFQQICIYNHMKHISLMFLVHLFLLIYYIHLTLRLLFFYGTHILPDGSTALITSVYTNNKWVVMQSLVLFYLDLNQ